MLRERMMRVLKDDPFVRTIIRRDAPIANIEYFAYPWRIDSVESQQTATTQVETAARSDFVLIALTGLVADNDGIAESGNIGVYNLPVTLSISEGTGNNPFFDGFADAQLLLVGAYQPFMFPAPRIFRPNSVIKIAATFQNSAAEVADVLVTGVFHGMQIVYGGDQ